MSAVSPAVGAARARPIPFKIKCRTQVTVLEPAVQRDVSEEPVGLSGSGHGLVGRQEMIGPAGNPFCGRQRLHDCPAFAKGLISIIRPLSGLEVYKGDFLSTKKLDREACPVVVADVDPEPGVDARLSIYVTNGTSRKLERVGEGEDLCTIRGS